MVGDSEVLIATAQRGLRHRFKRIETVRAVGVRVENSGYILIGHKLRQGSGESAGHLIATLAQLGRHWLHAKRFVDAVLASSCDELAAAPKAILVKAHVPLGRQCA